MGTRKVHISLSDVRSEGSRWYVIAGGGLSRFIIPWDVGPKVNVIAGGD